MIDILRFEWLGWITRSECETGHSTPCSVEDKNECELPSSNKLSDFHVIGLI